MIAGHCKPYKDIGDISMYNHDPGQWNIGEQGEERAG